MPLALAALLLAVPASLPEGGSATAQETAPASAPSPAVARGGELALSATALETVLLERHGMSEAGRALLRLLVSARLLEHLGAERGLVVTDGEVGDVWSELDRDIKASGDGGGLAAQIAAQGLSPAEFRAYLRLSILQERLAREALGLAQGVPVSGDQQEVWLEQELRERGLESPPPPWPDGVVARCEGVAVEVDAFATFLRERLPEEDVRETAWHLLLVDGIARRMPDVSREAREEAIDREMQRRREKHARENPGLGFEELLGAQGRTVAALRRDPAVRIAAFSRLWVDRTAGSEGLRATYEKERELFEGRFGKAVRTHMLFLVASRYKNELNPRTFADAEAELLRLTAEVGNGDDFAALARRHSEEPNTRQRGGDIGWMTRADQRVPPAIRDAVFRLLDSGAGIPPEGRSVGPLRLDTGCAVLWISGVRESPSWEVMAEHVHEELRRRFLEGILVPEDVELVEAGAPPGR